MIIKLAQTLAGNWVITIPNPEEAHMETELASFATDCTAEGSAPRAMLEDAAARTALGVEATLSEAWISVQSHDPAAAAAMRLRLAQLTTAAA